MSLQTGGMTGGSLPGMKVVPDVNLADYNTEYQKLCQT